MFTEKYETPERDDYEEENDRSHSDSHFRKQNLITDKQKFEEFKNFYHKAVSNGGNQASKGPTSTNKSGPNQKGSADSKKSGNFPQHRIANVNLLLIIFDYNRMSPELNMIFLMNKTSTLWILY